MPFPLVIFERCSCGTTAVQREPHLSNQCPTCGEAWSPARRAANADWPTQMVFRALKRACEQAVLDAASGWRGLQPAGVALVERVRTMACADRWVRTRIYAAATALASAHLAETHAARTRSAAQMRRSQMTKLARLREFYDILRSVGVRL